METPPPFKCCLWQACLSDLYLLHSLSMGPCQISENMGSLEQNSTTENGEQQPDSHFHHQAPSDILMRFLAANPSIEYIRYQWLDYSVLRVRNVTKSHCLSLATNQKPVVIPSCAHNILVDIIPYSMSTRLAATPCGLTGSLYGKRTLGEMMILMLP